jgi:uncharacterized protein (TIGR00369 family)
MVSGAHQDNGMPEPKTPAPLFELNRILRENRVADYRSPNLALGMRPLQFAQGSSHWRWETQPKQTINPFGMLHGGYLAVFVDELLATAIGSVLENGEWAVTAELKLTYLRALRPGRLEGRGRVIRRTRSIAFMDAEVSNADGQAAVLASSTWAISGLKS